MGQQRRKFSPQFKAEAVQLVIELDRPISSAKSPRRNNIAAGSNTCVTPQSLQRLRRGQPAAADPHDQPGGLGPTLRGPACPQHTRDTSSLSTSFATRRGPDHRAYRRHGCAPIAARSPPGVHQEGLVILHTHVVDDHEIAQAEKVDYTGVEFADHFCSPRHPWYQTALR